MCLVLSVCVVKPCCTTWLLLNKFEIIIGTGFRLRIDIEGHGSPRPSAVGFYGNRLYLILRLAAILKMLYGSRRELPSHY